MERKRCESLQRQDKIKRRNNVLEMKSAFTHWANLEAARDDTNLYCHQLMPYLEGISILGLSCGMPQEKYILNPSLCFHVITFAIFHLLKMLKWRERAPMLATHKQN